MHGEPACPRWTTLVAREESEVERAAASVSGPVDGVAVPTFTPVHHARVPCDH